MTNDIALKYKLPLVARSQPGVYYHPHEDFWPVPTLSSQGLDFKKAFWPYVTEDLFYSIKIAFYHLNKTSKPISMWSYYSNFRLFLKTALGENANQKINEITLRHCEQFVLARMAMPIKEPLAITRQVKRVMKNLSSRGLPNSSITSEALEYMEDLHLDRFESNRSVRTWCPYHGPFTDSEDFLLRNHIHAAYEKGELSLSKYLLALLFRFTLLRPDSMASLKVRHFKAIKNCDGTKSYSITLPNNTKERNGRFLDSEIEDRPLLPDIGRLIEEHLESIIKNYGHLCQDHSELPFFIRVPTDGKAVDVIRPYHELPNLLKDRVAAMYDRFNIITPRTGERINVHPNRFRVSGATWARRSGATRAEIAELLGHSDTSSARVYAAVDVTELEAIDRKMCVTEHALAKGFLGKWTDLPINLENQIYGKSGEVVGGCVNQCSLIKPLACFTCAQWTASIEAPLERELELLETERERVMIATNDQILAGINDLSIGTLKEIIEMKDKRLKQISKE